MKFFKSKNGTKWTWATMLFTGAISFGVLSCDDDSNDVDSTVVEVESGWLVGFRNDTPQGRVYYIGVYEGIPSETDPSNAVEIGLNARIFSFGESPYTWNGNAATMTKWAVNREDLSISVAGIVSFAGAGFSGDLTPPLLLSEERAFITKLTEGVIVEWNPTTMKITQTYIVDPLPTPGAGVNFHGENGKYITPSGKILMPIYYANSEPCCELTNVNPSTVAVFDPVTGTIQYNQDDRLFAHFGGFNIDENGTQYLFPTSNNSIVDAYFNIDEPTRESLYNVLKVDAEGNYDPNFELDLSEVVPISALGNSFFIQNNKLVFTYVDDSFTWPESYEDRFSSLFSADFVTVALDLTTFEVTKFSVLDDYFYVNSGWGNVIDNKNYFVTGTFDFNTSIETSFIVRQDGLENFTVLSTHVGGTFQAVNRLWGN
ncbi:MAG: hypothetical protein AAF620_14780 [Bacteroidota bacterium]